MRAGAAGRAIRWGARIGVRGRSVLVAVVVVRAWIGGDGTRLHRVLLSISAGASIVFALWLVVRGLLIL